MTLILALALVLAIVFLIIGIIKKNRIFKFLSIILFAAVGILVILLFFAIGRM